MARSGKKLEGKVESKVDDGALPTVMRLSAAAAHWGLSVQWLRRLIQSNRLAAVLNSSSPSPYYEIAKGTKRPPSYARAPLRQGSPSQPSPMAIDRRRRRSEGPVGTRRST